MLVIFNIIHIFNSMNIMPNSLLLNISKLRTICNMLAKIFEVVK